MIEATGSGAGSGANNCGLGPGRPKYSRVIPYVQYMRYIFVQVVLYLAGGGERRLQRGAGCHGGVQARQEEAKEDQERGEGEDQRFVSHSACFFSLFWIRIRMDPH